LKHLILYIIGCYAFITNAQTIPINDSIPVVEGCRITSDNLENLFIITPTNDIIRYDKNGKKMATANFKVLGNITSIDVTNPFEIYVFYRDQNKVIFLDNLLNLRGECDMESIGVSQIACLGRSADNQIWLFDVADLKLKKYSKDLKLIIESASFSTFNAGTDIYPTLIKDINNAVFMLDQNKILEFDIFANFSKIRLIDTLQSFQYINEKIVFLKKGRIYMFNPIDFGMRQLNIQLPPNTKNIRIEKERLFVLTDEYVILQTFTEK
jgi:hypothetical protein